MTILKRGRKLPRVNSETEFLEKLNTEKTRINLGDGLFLLNGKHENKSFHFRMTITGNDTSGIIGWFPDMSFEKARRIADERKAQIKEMKRLEKATTLKEKLKQQNRRINETKPPCFTRLSDAGILYANVLNKGVESLEFKAVALLTLLLPTLYEDLVNTIKGNYNYFSKTLTITDLGSWNKGIAFQVPEELANIIHQPVHSADSHQDTQPLFPELSKMSQKEREKILVNIYEDEYTQNSITNKSLCEFFAFTAEKYGGFNKEFVSQLTSKQKRKTNQTQGSTNSSYIKKEIAEHYFYWRQRNAAIYWYADQILRGSNAFDRISNPYAFQNECSPISTWSENLTIPSSI